MSDKVYNVLTAFARTILPALATLYAALAGVWGLPYAEPIVATLGALTVFLNAILKAVKNKWVTSQEDSDGTGNR